MDCTADHIREWHTALGWSDIGYNLFIRRNGFVEMGRPLEARGAHVKGYNDVALGICLAGGVDEDAYPEDNFTIKQKQSLAQWIKALRLMYPTAIIQGHRDFPRVSKACPSFDVSEFIHEWIDAPKVIA